MPALFFLAIHSLSAASPLTPLLLPKSKANSISQVLAVGFLLVILSCALDKEYLPLLVVATYVLAPLPNFICGRLANPDDFGSDGAGSALLDFGKFVTGALVVMGIGRSHFFFTLLSGGSAEGEAARIGNWTLGSGRVRKRAV